MCEIEFALFALCAIVTNTFPKFRHTYLPNYNSEQLTIFCVVVYICTLGDSSTGTLRSAVWMLLAHSISLTSPPGVVCLAQ